MNTYTKYHVSWIPTEKVEYITTKALDIMAISQKQEKRDCNVNIRFNEYKIFRFRKEFIDTSNHEKFIKKHKCYILFQGQIFPICMQNTK